MKIYEDENGLEIITLESNQTDFFMVQHKKKTLCAIKFQSGTIPNNGVNGVTNEALLAVLISRTEILNGKFPCMENEIAIMNMKNALDLFEARTKNHVERGVEGKDEL